METEGLLTTYTGHGATVYPEYIQAVLARYARVEACLKSHDMRYPDAASLSGIVAAGNPCYGLEQIGEGKDTDGSNLIVRAARKTMDDPLWILIWGGSLDLARALYHLRSVLSHDELLRVLDTLRVYAIGERYGVILTVPKRNTGEVGLGVSPEITTATSLMTMKR